MKSKSVPIGLDDWWGTVYARFAWLPPLRYSLPHPF